METENRSPVVNCESRSKMNCQSNELSCQMIDRLMSCFIV